jgi:hypothetical protein
MTKIIYPIRPELEDSPVAVITPSTSTHFTLEQIALKDVPAGTPFKYVDDETIPTNRAFRDAWYITVSELDMDGTGADFGVGSDNYTPADWYEQDEPPEWEQDND